MGGGGGGKGGSQETTTTMEPPAWMTPYLKEALASGSKQAKMGYVPYIGPDVAAFNPQQIAGMQQSADLATAFGMGAPQDVAASIPTPETFAGGIQGYSSFPMYHQAQKELAQKYPGLSDYLKSFSINPKTGKMRGSGGGGSGGNSFFGSGGGSGGGGGFGGGMLTSSGGGNWGWSSPYIQRRLSMGSKESGLAGGGPFLPGMFQHGLGSAVLQRIHNATGGGGGNMGE